MFMSCYLVQMILKIFSLSSIPRHQPHMYNTFPTTRRNNVIIFDVKTKIIKNSTDGTRNRVDFKVEKTVTNKLYGKLGAFYFSYLIFNSILNF